jgi:hypothetical protein
VGPDDVGDPRAFRWVESGVSGLARPREWDATALVEVDALRGLDVAELHFRLLADGSVVGDVPLEVLSALTEELGLEPPYAVRAVRRGETAWAVGALRVQSDPIDLPEGIEASSLEVAVAPDGERTFVVEGEMLPGEPAGPEAEALAAIERAGRERFQAFAARADRVGDGRWELTVDPL